MENTRPTFTLPLFLLFTLSLLPFLTTAKAPSPTFNVATYGARPNGKTDSSNAFMSAWNAACGSPGRPTVYVPPGRFFIGKALTFSGLRCKNKGFNFMIKGTLLAPSNFRVLGNAGTWLMFEDVAGLSLSGGVLDGQGAGLWTCKLARKGGCPTGLTNLGFTNSMNIKMRELKSVNSQLFHIVVNGCKNVKIQGVTVSGPRTGPNTDGIHVQLSTGVTIVNTNIATGDDCISIGAGTTNMWMEEIKCGPGHGISIGSLGKDSNEAGVQNITVNTATFTGTENGVRIKSWARPSNGYVRNVLFQHITMVNAQNPIVIDQHYCPANRCPREISGIRISGVTYQDIHGSSATPVGIKFDCSSEYHCNDITLDNVMLTYNNKPATSTCSNVGGSAYGSTLPTCL